MYKKRQKPAQLEIPFEEFALPFRGKLDGSNRWIILSGLIPWDKFEDQYSENFSKEMGANAISFRIALGALIIKERLNLTDREAVDQIRENPYLQYFLGYKEFKTDVPFDPSMYVHFRKRISHNLVSEMNKEIVISSVSKVSKKDNNDDDSQLGKSVETEKREGKLIIDSTCTPADIRYPTDLSILNEAREKSEKIIDLLWGFAKVSSLSMKKPRTYRRKARKDFLKAIRRKCLSHGQRRKAIRKQLNYLHRNLKSIAILKDYASLKHLPKHLYKSLLVISEVYRQQWFMFSNNKRSIEDRIVSITQPHVRPIIRGKVGKPVEFGAKISASVVNGYTFIDRLCWDAYNEGGDLQGQALAYRERFGHFPKSIHADKVYRNRANRDWCMKHNIRLSGPALGRPRKVTEENRSEIERERIFARQDELDRICIEGKFGQSKRRFSLSRVMAKLRITSESVISMVVLVMNLEKLLVKVLFSFQNCLVSIVYKQIIRFLRYIELHKLYFSINYCLKYAEI